MIIAAMVIWMYILDLIQGENILLHEDYQFVHLVLEDEGSQNL